MRMRILVIDDEWEDRKETYLKLKDVRGADIDLDSVEAPAQIRDKLSSGPYDIYLVDVMLAEWGDVSLHRVLEDLGDRAPA